MIGRINMQSCGKIVVCFNALWEFSVYIFIYICSFQACLCIDVVLVGGHDNARFELFNANSYSFSQ